MFGKKNTKKKKKSAAKDKSMEKAIKQARKIALTGSIEEKRSFVNWASGSIEWLSSQCGVDTKAPANLARVKAQYEAYLKALIKKPNRKRG